MPGLEISRWPDDRPLETKSVAEVWARDGFSCDLWVDPPGEKWLDFVHPTGERVVVKEGVLEFKVEGARSMVRPGDMAFMPARSHHSVWNRGSSTARRFFGYRHG